MNYKIVCSSISRRTEGRELRGLLSGQVKLQRSPNIIASSLIVWDKTDDRQYGQLPHELELQKLHLSDSTVRGSLRAETWERNEMAGPTTVAARSSLFR